MSDPPVVLTIAGFDPSGGAGIIADARTINQFGCRAVAAITSITFQNSTGLFGAHHQTAESLRAQILAIVEDTDLAAVKIGMLPTAELVSVVVQTFREKALPAPVLDPVLKSSSGHELSEPDALEILKRELLPLVRLVTPNVPEAEILTGSRISDAEGMRRAATKLRQMGARAVLIKGGHLQSTAAPGATGVVREAIDVLNDQEQVEIFRADWIEARPVRGTGCMLSSAIAAGLARGEQLKEAIAMAKQFVRGEISKFQIPVFQIPQD